MGGGLLSNRAVFEAPVDFAGASFRGRVRFDGVLFEADSLVGQFPSVEPPDRWSSVRRSDGTWDIRLLDAEA